MCAWRRAATSISSYGCACSPACRRGSRAAASPAFIFFVICVVLILKFAGCYTAILGQVCRQSPNTGLSFHVTS